MEWDSLGLRDNSSVFYSAGEVRVMFSHASLADGGALLNEASRFPDVADDGPVDGSRVPLPLSLSLCLLLIERALVEEAARFSAENR